MNQKNETLQKIEKGVIRIENGHLVGLGNDPECSIDLTALDELLGYATPQELSGGLAAMIMRLGVLGMHLYRNSESFPDNGETISINLPQQDDMYNLHLLQQLFSKSK